MKKPSSELLILCGILAAALALRLPAIGWGLPPAIPHVIVSDIRSSYAFDEDDLLTYVSFTRPAQFDFDMGLYHWGTAHMELTLAWLEAAQRLGIFNGPWRAAYYQMTPGAFERVYETGRLLSMLMAVAGLGMAYLLGRELYGGETGLWAAAILAASPPHLLGSVQIRTDLTMTALVTLAAWLAVRIAREPRQSLFWWLGVTAGLAVTAKYPAAFVVAGIFLGMVKMRQAFSPARLSALAAGVAAGVLLGQPYILTRLPAMIAQLRQITDVTSQADAYRVSALQLLGRHAAGVIRFGIGPLLAIAALAGLWRTPRSWILIGALAGGVASLIPLAWPMLRYTLPLLPFLAVAAGAAMTHIPRPWHWIAGAAALAFPLGASLGQLDYMLMPHPANRMLRVILETVPPNTPVSRLMAELPPLDRKVYPMGSNPFIDDLTRDPPAWVLTADLPDPEYPAANRKLLATAYEQVAEMRSIGYFSWATLGESRAPHDWKYTHPCMVLYRRRS